MFKKKRCPKCDKEVKDEWEFCPFCGYSLKERYRSEERFFEEFEGFRDIDRIFERMEREFEELLKMPSFKIPKIRISSPGFSGISITIHSGTGMKPKVEVKTYGEYKKLEPEIKRRLGVKVPVEEVEEEKEVEYEAPKTTEEPEAKVSRIGNKTIVEIKLPDVESEKDIDVKKLEQSIEIRAKAKDKLYFKLLPISGEIVSKSFKDGILKIEIER